MGKVQGLFPKFYYHGEVKAHEYIKKLLLSELDTATLSQPTEWNCNVQSSFEEDSNDDDFSWNVFAKAIRPNLDEMHEQLGGKPLVQIKMCESWINVYKKGDSQEVHTHCGGDNTTFSCAYFLQYDPQIDARFIFYNPDQNCHLGYFSRHYPVINTWFPEVNEGDIIIFPSYVHHQVDTQRNYRHDRPRVTVSANFRLENNVL